MDISDLKLFLAIAESESISGAAVQLHTVQSNVSTRLRTLEHRLGAPLFHRHARGVTLTSSGEIFLPYARQITRLMDEGMSVIADVDNPAGTLTLGAMETTAGWRLPDLLAGFAEDCPKVAITLKTGPTEDLLRDVLDYRLEGAFVSGPVDMPELSAITAFTEELVLVVGRRHRSPGGDSESTGGYDLLDQSRRLLVFRHGCSYRRRLIDLTSGDGTGPLPSILEFGSLEGILGCVAAGVGVTLLPASVVRSSSLRPQLTLQKLPQALSRAETVFVRRADVPLGPAMSHFVSHLRDFADRPGRPASRAATSLHPVHTSA